MFRSLPVKAAYTHTPAFTAALQQDALISTKEIKNAAVQLTVQI